MAVREMMDTVGSRQNKKEKEQSPRKERDISTYIGPQMTHDLDLLPQKNVDVKQHARPFASISKPDRLSCD